MTQIAREYGMGLYELAQEENLREEIHAQLESVAEIFRQNPDFIRLLGTHGVALEERFAILDDVLKGKVHPYILNFIKILMERGIASMFEACVQVYHRQYNQDFGLGEARVMTAVPLSRASAQALRERLEEISGKKITLIESVDPKLLGGVRVEMDGHRMDNTIQTRLEVLRRSLAESF